VAAYVLRPLAQGRTSLGLASVRRGLAVVETAQPEGTRMQLDLDWADLTLPVVGRVDLAAAAAAAVNAFHQATHTLTLWPGESRPATHSGRRTTVRWVKMAPGVAAVLTAVEDGTAAEAAPEAAAGTAALAILAAALAGFLVWQYLTHWAFSRAVIQGAGKAAQAVGGIGKALIVGGTVLAGIMVIRGLRRI